MLRIQALALENKARLSAALQAPNVIFGYPNPKRRATGPPTSAHVCAALTSVDGLPIAGGVPSNCAASLAASSRTIASSRWPGCLGSAGWGLRHTQTWVHNTPAVMLASQRWSLQHRLDVMPLKVHANMALHSGESVAAEHVPCSIDIGVHSLHCTHSGMEAICKVLTVSYLVGRCCLASRKRLPISLS